MSEYCGECDEVLDWLHDNMDNREDCVKCQIIKAIEPLVANNQKMRDALDSIIEAEDPKDMYDTAKGVLDELFPLSATQRGFKVGETYRHKQERRCTYHIVSETHFTAVFIDGKNEPTVSTVDNLGYASEYEVQP